MVGEAALRDPRVFGLAQHNDAAEAQEGGHDAAPAQAGGGTAAATEDVGLQLRGAASAASTAASGGGGGGGSGSGMKSGSALSELVPTPAVQPRAQPAHGARSTLAKPAVSAAHSLCALVEEYLALALAHPPPLGFK